MIVAEGISVMAVVTETEGLQWGRNLIVAEGGITTLPGGGVFVLQWGRNLIVAEGQRLAPVCRQDGPASMGPQLDSCGRLQTALCVRVCKDSSFNGAAT